MNRRMFLRTAAGAMVAIPFLPSVLTRTFAADPGPGEVGKCFFAIGTEHGAAFWGDLYPDPTILNQTMDYAGRTVRFGDLPFTPDVNGDVVFSPICTAKAAVMTPSLAKKFNLIKGVDLYYIGHSCGGRLGAFADSLIATKTPSGGSDNSAYRTATIDQFMAYSPSFYSQDDLESKLTQRSFCVGSGKMSWGYANPLQKLGKVTHQPAFQSSLNLFNHFFKPGETLGKLDTYLVDRITQSHARLKNDPRLSKGDGQRLDQYMDRLFEIERMMNVAATLPDPPPTPNKDSAYYPLQHAWPHDPASHAAYCDLITEVIVQAFASGVSRIGTWNQYQMLFNLVPYTSWHGSIFHKGVGVDLADSVIFTYLRGTFEHIMVNLAAKMDAVVMADDQTLLDHSLITFTQEAGQWTHQSAGSLNFPVITAGGAGGFFKTGMFVDYSNQNIVYDGGSMAALKASYPKLSLESPGLYYQQFLGTAMQSMGVPTEEYEHFTEFTSEGPAKSDPTKGYGFHYVDPKLAADYAQAKLVMGDKLPVIT